MITILRQCVVLNILGCYLEGQGHSMTLQQNHIQPITSLFEVWFTTILTNYFSVSNTYSGSITRFDRLLFAFDLKADTFLEFLTNWGNEFQR